MQGDCERSLLPMLAEGASIPKFQKQQIEAIIISQVGHLRRYNESVSEPITHDDLNALETRLLERMERTETTLLREFRKWAVSFESVFRANEIVGFSRQRDIGGGFNERVIALEERVGDLERRSGAPE